MLYMVLRFTAAGAVLELAGDEALGQGMNACESSDALNCAGVVMVAWAA